ncbi:protein Vdh [Mrakia frigida]|uniref:protein Vdh n=1 Tax=Mrakia frigida TaxID=29902 RepID=UPI003FCBFD49
MQATLARSFAASKRTLFHDVPLWINGQSVTSKKSFDVKHPISGEIVSRVSASEEGDVQAALQSSNQAFPAWSRLPAHERRTVLNRVAELLEERKGLFSEVYGRETCVGGLVRHVDWTYSMIHIKEAASLATQIKGDIPQTVDGSLALVLREPYGTVLSISPFNFGLTLAIRAIVYPLTCGNTVLLKASPLIPETHFLLGQLFKDAGLPDGCLNILQFGNEDVGAMVDRVIGDPRIRMVNFTGSEAIGKVIGESCGRHVKPVLLELGGKACALVLETADLEAAAHAIIFGSNIHSGQTCMCTERAIVVESVYDEFELIIRGKGKELAAALADSTKTAVGEMEVAGEGPARKVRGLVEDALAKGATNLTDDLVSLEDHHASKVQPVLLSGVTSDMKIYFEESFGPALSLIKATSTAHAVEIANSSQYGLSSSIWSKDIMTALSVARSLECSAVHLNSTTVHDESSLPHGGHKSSGSGRFNGSYAIQSFTQTKTVTFRTGEGMAPLDLLA